MALWWFYISTTIIILMYHEYAVDRKCISKVKMGLIDTLFSLMEMVIMHNGLFHCFQEALIWTQHKNKEIMKGINASHQMVIKPSIIYFVFFFQECLSMTLRRGSQYNTLDYTSKSSYSLCLWSRICAEESARSTNWKGDELGKTAVRWWAVSNLFSTHEDECNMHLFFDRFVVICIWAPLNANLSNFDNGG